MNTTDPHDEVAEQLIKLKRTFYAAIENAASTGFPVGRLVRIVGFGNCRYVFGDEAVREFSKHNQPMPAPPPAPRVPGASPAMMPSRNT